MTDASQSHTPLPQLVARLNRHLEGWANYFSYGYPRGAWWEIDWFVRGRLIRHLKRRSQRPYRPPEGVGWFEHFQRSGLVLLHRRAPKVSAHAGGDLFWRAGCGKSARPVRRREGHFGRLLLYRF